MVSVPIGGLFNLTLMDLGMNHKQALNLVSVPIGGLFNLTIMATIKKTINTENKFPSPLGDYLI